MANHEGAPRPAAPEVTPDDPNDLPPIPDDIESTSPDDLEQSIEDQQNRVRDAEILGKSFRVRLAIDRGAGAAISAAHDRIAKTSNLLSAPKNAYLNRRHEISKARHSRKERKADQARANARNASEMADNSPNRIFKGKWRANRLEKKASKLTNKANNYKRDVLNVRANAYNGHTAMMKGRTERAEKTRENQQSIHERKIAMFKDRKTLAKGNKELRKLRKEMIRQNRRDKVQDWTEVNAKFNNVSLAERKRFGEICCLREVANRNAEDINRHKLALESEQRSNNKGLETSIQAVVDKTQTRDKAHANARSAEEVRAGFAAQAEDLQQQLDRGSDHEGTELTETGRANLQEQLQRAHASAEQAAEKAREFSEQASRLDAEISSLERTIDKREQNVDRYEAKLETINNSFNEHATKADEIEAEYQAARAEFGPTPRQEAEPLQPAPAPDPAAQPSTPPPSAPPDNVIDFPTPEARQARDHQGRPPTSPPDDLGAAA